MKKLIKITLSFLLILINIQATTVPVFYIVQAAEVPVTIENFITGKLSGANVGSAIASATDLTIKGTMNEADFTYLTSSLTNKITRIDMSKATLPDNTLPSNAFENSSSPKKFSNLNSVILPVTLEKIGDNAFSDCTGLSVLDLSNTNLKYIGYLAFNNCSKLTTIVLPKITSVHADAFYSSNIKNLTINNATAGSLSAVLPNSLAINLTNLTITGNMNDADFAHLRSVLTSKITKIDISEVPLTNYKLPNYAFDNTASYANGKYNNLKSVILPNNLTEIGNSTFNNCKQLVEINLSENLELIGSFAFNNTGIKTIILPSKVVHIAMYAFSDCSQLEDIVIPEGVEEIGVMAFYNCTSLTNIILPKSINILYGYAFDNSGLSGILKLNSTPEIYPDDFNPFSNTKVTHLLVPNDAENYSIDNVTFLNYYDDYDGDGVDNITEYNAGGRNLLVPEINVSLAYDEEKVIPSFSSTNPYAIIQPQAIPSIEDYEIKYKGASGTVYSESAIVPTASGNYIATFSLLDAAKDKFNVLTENLTTSFGIKEVNIFTLTCPNVVYGNPVVPNVTGNKAGDVTYKYKVLDSDDETYSSTPPTNVGKYTVRATVSANEQYKEYSDTYDFEIIKKDYNIDENTEFQAFSKTFDGNTSATLNHVDLETGVIIVAYGTFENADSGKGKKITINSYEISESSSTNYNIIFPTESIETTGEIKPKEITITSGIKASDKTYDGTNDASFNAITVTESMGLIDDAKLSITATGKFSSANASDVVSIDDFELVLLDENNESPTNYILSSSSQQTVPTAKISKKSLTISSVVVSNKTYNGLSTATVLSVELLGIVSNDKVTWSYNSASFASSAVGSAISIDFGDGFILVGDDVGNYTLSNPNPTGVTANINAGEVPIEGTHYSVNTTDKNGWYITSDLIITAKSGYLISFTNTANGTWSNSLTISDETVGSKDVSFYIKNSTGEISQIKTISYKKDNTSPTGTINIKTNTFTQLLNTITFGLFFKNTVDVTISGSDVNDTTIYYQKVANKSSYDANGTWTTGSSFTVNASEQFIVYAKIVDVAGNTTIINSDGVVVYQDSAVSTTSLTFTKTSITDLEAFVTLNSNTIKSISNGETTLIKDIDYNVDGNKITLKTTYLDSLAAGSYTLSVNYNPFGYTNDTEIPSVTTIALSVTKATPIVTVQTSTSSPTRPSSITISSTISSGATGTVQYYANGIAIGSPVAVGQTVTFVATGETNIYSFTATYSGDGSYNSASSSESPTATFTKGSQPALSFNVDTPSAKTYGDPSFDVTATGGRTGGTVSYSVSGPATITGNTITITGAGTITVTATVSANDDYNAATKNHSITVSEKLITISGIIAENKIYDKSTSATLSIPIITTAMGLITGDTTTVTGIGTFDDENVGVGKKVTISELSLSNGNYTLIGSIQQTETSADITVKDITISGITAENKVYDGNTDATLIYDEVVFEGIKNGDSLTICATGTFIDENAQEGKIISITNLLLAGTSISNYSLATSGQQTSTYANITKAAGETVDSINAAITSTSSITVDMTTTSSFAVEYGISTSQDLPTSWQSSPTFTNLAANTAYYVFVRTVATENFEAGLPLMSDVIRTNPILTALTTDSSVFDTHTTTSNVKPVSQNTKTVQSLEKNRIFEVIKMIEALPSVIVLRDEKTIIDARTAYDELNEEEKSKVDQKIYQLLEVAEKAYAKLLEEAPTEEIKSPTNQQITDDVVANSVLLDYWWIALIALIVALFFILILKQKKDK